MPGQELLEVAIARHREGDLDGAERCYREILNHDPGYAEAMHMLGVLRHQRGDSIGGVELVRKAIGLDSNRAAYHDNLGEILRAQGQLHEAVDAYRRAIELAPEQASAHNNLGIALHSLDDISGAIACFEVALRLAPKFPEAAMNLGDILRKSGQMEAAAGAFERAVAINPNFYEAQINLGSCLLELGQLARATECFSQAVGRWPSRPEGHVGLGNSLLAAFRHEDALDCYRQALSVDPDTLGAHMGIGAVCAETDALDEAAAAYREVLRLDPVNVDGRANLAIIEADRGNADEAERICRDTLSLGKKSGSVASEADYDHLSVDVESSLCFVLGKVHDDRGDYAQAFHHYAHANRLYRAGIEHDPARRDEFVDHALAIFDTDLLKRIRAAGEPSKRPVFIVGMPHSGKSLVEQILASHPLVDGAGELDYFQRIMVSAGGDVPFLESVPTLSVEIGNRIARDYLALLTHVSSRAQRVTNTMPYNFLCLGLIGALIPNATIVHCERDPRDIGVSIYFEKYDSGNWYAYDLYEIGRCHAQYRRLMAHWEFLLPRRIFTVRYEDLVANQLSESRRLLRHCGLEWDDRCLDFYEHSRPIHTAGKWKVRQAIHSRFVGRWKHYAQWIGPLEKGLEDSGTREEQGDKTVPSAD